MTPIAGSKSLGGHPPVALLASWAPNPQRRGQHVPPTQAVLERFSVRPHPRHLLIRDGKKQDIAGRKALRVWVCEFTAETA